MRTINQSFLRPGGIAASLIALACGLALAGCSVHAHGGPPPHHHARIVTVKAGHVHSHRCGHYLHRGKWYHVRGHVHGARCGHAHVRGVWVLRR